MTKDSNKMWGGRFESKPSEVMQEINQSISFDWQLYAQDVAGSIAHCKMLAKTGIISQDEATKIVKGLTQILGEIENGQFVFKKELEDIHMNIESRLKEIIGDVAGKLHTARSRNDQVATDFGLFVRAQIDDILALLLDLAGAFVDKAEKNSDVIMPGFTHLQTAQPVLFSHHMMAYFEMFKRDITRFEDLRTRMNECPLGSCALGGTSFPIDRHFVSDALGFDKPTANSMDSVSDRDFAAEFLFCSSLVATHLSRLGEEIVLWISKGFDFVSLSDAFTSGSSIMPQKKNPDAAELIRGKSGRIFGSLFALLTVLKGLPLTYSKDMQEDKEPVFDAAHNIKLCLQAATGMVFDMKVNEKKMLEAAKAGFSTATDLADYLVKNFKIPFRQAHHITGSIVKLAENKNCDLCDLKLSELQGVFGEIDEGVFKVLSVEDSVASKTSYGSSSLESVKAQIKNARAFLK